jgi:hypothetical protein
LLLLGVREDLLALTAEQDMNGMLTYKNPAATVDKTVECVVSSARFESLGLPDSVAGDVERSRRYVRFELRGQLQYSPFGLVFGVLPFPTG